MKMKSGTKLKRKTLTPSVAQGILTKRIKAFIAAGGSLEADTWGDIGLNTDAEIILKDGPTCAIGAALVGLTAPKGTVKVNDWGGFSVDETKAASKLFGLRINHVCNIVQGFDGDDYRVSLSPWRKVGLNLRKRFLGLVGHAAQEELDQAEYEAKYGTEAPF